MDDGKIAGPGGCNRFNGRMDFFDEGIVKVGPLAGTKLMCPTPRMDQETTYMATSRIAFDGDDLVLHVAGADTPLRFTRIAKQRRRSRRGS